MKKVGIFAGTFDPIHNGHLALAEEALKTGLEKVYFLAEPRPWRKQGVRALEHRQAMVDEAIKKQRKFGSIHFEKARLTPQTALPILQSRFEGAKLALLFGDDVIVHMVDHLADWPHIEDLARTTELLIAARHSQHKDIEDKLQQISKLQSISFVYSFITPNKASISSSKLRKILKSGKLPIEMPKGAALYAKQQGLYTSGSSTD